MTISSTESDTPAVAPSQLQTIPTNIALLQQVHVHTQSELPLSSVAANTVFAESPPYIEENSVEEIEIDEAEFQNQNNRLLRPYDPLAALSSSILISTIRNSADIATWVQDSK